MRKSRNVSFSSVRSRWIRSGSTPSRDGHSGAVEGTAAPLQGETGGAVHASGEAHSSRDPPRGGALTMEHVADPGRWEFQAGAACHFDRLHNLANQSRDGAGDAGPQRTSPTRRITSFRPIVDNVSMRPELLAENGATRWWRAATRSREKSLGGRLRGRCDSFVVASRRAITPTDLGLRVGWGAVSDPGDGASGGGTRNGRLAATPASWASG